MKQYKKNYLKAFDYTIADNIMCEVCNAPAVDIHHVIYKSQGGTDEASNLIALCRYCHNKAHNESGCKDFQIKLQEICSRR